MDLASKRRSRPPPDAVNMKPLAFNLEEALSVENTYRPNLLLIQQDIQPWEVTISHRDGAVHILRFLRVWFEVPQQVFFSAVTYLDLFLSRMKVQVKYLNCLTLACFHCAAEKQGCNIDLRKLVAVAQRNGSLNDLLRMTKILKEKLNLGNKDNDRTTTSADFLLIFLEVMEYITACWEVTLHTDDFLQTEQLLTRLEVLMTNNNTAFFRSSTLALVLIKLELEKLLTQGIATGSMYFINELIQLLSVVRELQLMCKIKSTDLVNCSSNVSNVLKQYDSQDRMGHGQITQGRSASGSEKGNRFRYFQLLDTIEEKNQKNPQ